MAERISAMEFEILWITSPATPNVWVCVLSIFLVTYPLRCPKCEAGFLASRQCVAHAPILLHVREASVMLAKHLSLHFQDIPHAFLVLWQRHERLVLARLDPADPSERTSQCAERVWRKSAKWPVVLYASEIALRSLRPGNPGLVSQVVMIKLGQGFFGRTSWHHSTSIGRFYKSYLKTEESFCRIVHGQNAQPRAYRKCTTCLWESNKYALPFSLVQYFPTRWFDTCTAQL